VGQSPTVFQGLGEKIDEPGVRDITKTIVAVGFMWMVNWIEGGDLPFPGTELVSKGMPFSTSMAVMIFSWINDIG